MDIAAIAVCVAVIEAGGIRAAARVTGRPAASVSAAMRRVEAALSLPLLRREAQATVPTVEARRRLPELRAIARAAEMLAPRGREGADGDVTTLTISLTVLFRFVALADGGSIRATAARLGIGQPQLSRQIAALEADTGRKLVERQRDGVRLTAEGAALLPVMRGIVDRWQRLAAGSGLRFRHSATTWRLGTIMPLGPESRIARLLAALLDRWHRERPRQPLYLSSTTADELIAGLRHRRFDAALLDVADLPTGVEGRPVASAGLALMAARRPGEDTAGARPQSLLAGRPLALPSPQSGLRQIANRYLDDTFDGGQRQRLHLAEVDSIPVILNLVLHHGYAAILPETAVAAPPGNLLVLPLPDEYRQTLSLVWLPEPAARDGAQAVLSMLHDLSRAAMQPESDWQPAGTRT
ncbi:transcriptional regulator, LysR family [Rhizobium sp. RU20A]|uniref:LysR family transcriptional regulator n=1 Tax=Rhizobium sp. RU20A TaxID=1907412 RepID=UPI000955981E|nr:LysR family transcriptional regulator [Rhizobium sp. RU20A]SIQ23385.1 transcriptional regulator, LysR family [Rhizobium sp. RU20A]